MAKMLPNQTRNGTREEKVRRRIRTKARRRQRRKARRRKRRKAREWVLET